MLSNSKTPREYLKKLDHDWRRTTLLDIRTIILRQAPKLDERMHYKMLGYGIDDDYVFHLNAQKAYVSLYVGDAWKIDPAGELLGGLSVGKGCIRFGKAVNVSHTRIDEFIARTVRLWSEGDSIDC